MSKEHRHLNRREFIQVGTAAVLVTGASIGPLANTASTQPIGPFPEGAFHTLYADESRGFLLILDHTYDEATDTLSDLNLSWRDYFEWTGDLEPEHAIPLSKFRALRDDHRMEPHQLDNALDEELRIDAWKRHFGPEAQAYELLDGLGFNGDDVIAPTNGYSSEIRESGILIFSNDREGKAVYCQDEYSVLGLREALNDLGCNVDIEIV
jgi:hypothetical protein